MINLSQQKKIKKKNKEIEDAILVSQMMEHPGYGVAKRALAELQKKFRFQDIMGIKRDNLEDQQGIVLGINEVQEYFKKQDKLALTPRHDPGTGEPEILNKKK